VENAEMEDTRMNAFYYRLLGEDNPLLHYTELYEATLDEFSQKCFEDASLNNILKAANMSKGSFYHNFGDKYGLYIALMDRIVQKKTVFFLGALKKRRDKVDFFLTVKLLINATIKFLKSDSRLYHILNRNLEASEEFRQMLLEIFPHNPHFEFGFESLACAALDSGQIDGRYSAGFISDVFKVLLEHIDRLLPSNRPAEEIETITDQLIDMIQYGIAAKKKM
jgi:AcrR family transcriptional regulator